MTISAVQVKELRERTGAGMMECKKALVECGGDMAAAVEHLRKSGLAMADKKSGRVAAEGVIIEAGNEAEAVLVEVNCETDFVAKDDNFLGFASQVANAALSMGSNNIDDLDRISLSGEETVEAARQLLVAKLGENIQVRRMVRLAASSGRLGRYVHGGRIGVLIEVDGGDEELAKNLAMHVAALNPEYLDADRVPGDVLAREAEILRAQIADSGKPPEIVEKIISGRLNKRLAEITLLGQPFVRDDSVSVGELLDRNGASVKAFVRLQVGEGIDKKESDFAAEVRQARGT